MLCPRMVCVQSCEEIADGEVVEVMREGESVAEAVPAGQNADTPGSEFTTL